MNANSITLGQALGIRSEGKKSPDPQLNKILLAEKIQGKLYLYYRNGEDGKVNKTFVIVDTSPVGEPPKNFDDLQKAVGFFYR